ncbi:MULTISPECIES: ZIP family metal transporter [Paenibacillus]|jgi:ZIP family zinc transporter/zinc and cadmium transporter|uniref:ZIP family metal transporter n=1 Tax=Paenibacillus TaxID=44249 RepID=UPI00096E21E1|nr:MULTISPECIES: ZIP family metal transporter [Paenibacillus]MXO77159.1 hypothetical protein [Paenibacillus sp. OT2-17]OMF23816.1 hypothetical protein BK134_26415 [Paenibacillus peoriae]
MIWIIIFVSLISIICTLIGPLVILSSKVVISELTKQRIIFLSAGLFLALATIDLLPEAFEINPHSGIYFALGIIALFLINGSHYHCSIHSVHSTHINKTTFWAFLSIVLLHSFFDGFSVISLFHTETYTGIAVLISLLLHKFPEGLAVASFLIFMLEDKRKVFISLSIIIFFNLIGSIFSIFLIQSIEMLQYNISIILSITAGFFVFISCVEILPMLNEKKTTMNKFYVILGFGTILVLHVLLH